MKKRVVAIVGSLTIAGMALAAPAAMAAEGRVSSPTESQLKAALVSAPAAAKATGLEITKTSSPWCTSDQLPDCSVGFTQVVNRAKPTAGPVQVRTYPSSSEAKRLVSLNKKEAPTVTPETVVKTLKTGKDEFARYYLNTPKDQIKAVSVMKAVGPYMVSTYCTLPNDKASKKNVSTAYKCADSLISAQAASLKASGLL